MCWHKANLQALATMKVLTAAKAYLPASIVAYGGNSERWKGTFEGEGRKNAAVAEDRILL